MDKLKLAHDYALVRLTCSNPKTLDEIIRLSWYYADAMQAEAEKRKPSGLPEALCQVDWSVAPEEANVYFKDGDNEPPKWFDRNNKLVGTAPDFGFSGYVCVERPHGF